MAENSGFGFGFSEWLNCTIISGGLEWRKEVGHAGYVSVCEILDSLFDGQSQALLVKTFKR
jgi:hypothetical protein